MSSKRYQFSGSTADADILSPDMSWTYERGYVSFVFYSDAALTNVVTPLGGTIITTVSENGDIYGSVSEGSTSVLNVGPSATYLRPNWAGSARKLKLNLAGITGSAFFKCVISRFGV